MCLRVCVSMSSCVRVSVGISYEVNLKPQNPVHYLSLCLS